MRLIDTGTGQFAEFFDLEKIPPYAILSHTWEPAPIGEQSYQDVVKIQEKYRLSASDDDPPLDAPQFAPTRRSIWDHDSGLSSKIRAACDVARRDGYRYIWIDSSCIDKASSSELSEAINSMYNWYRGAQVCYAFLADVPSNENARADSSKFRNSRWFTRGWTLQELIAPRMVVFFSQEWEGLGTKDGLADLIQDITFVGCGVLTHKIALSDESVAERMRWAAGRETTRVEDEAYSLLGIFEITMPTLYGEGRHAFRRLQEEILRRIPDQSLFAWGSSCLPTPQVPSDISVDDGDTQSPFASSPRSFKSSSQGKIIRASGPNFESLELPLEEYTHTPYGIRTQLRFLPLQALNLTVSGVSQPNTRAWYFAILASQKDDDPGRLLSRLCYIDYSKSNVNFLHVPERLQLSGTGFSSGRDSFIFLISPDDLLGGRSTQLETRTVYLPHPEPFAATRRLDGSHPRLKLSHSIWVKAALRRCRCIISDIHSMKDDPDTYYFVLSSASLSIHVQYRHIVVNRIWLPMALVIETRVWILPPDHDEHHQSNIVQHTPPYTSTIWTDEEPWSMTLPLRDIDLPTNSGDNVNLQLGLGLTAPSTYNVHAEVATTHVATRAVAELSTRAASKHLHTVIQGPHADIKLTMLGSTGKELEAAGYVVDFEGPQQDEGSWYRSYSCTLRPINATPSSREFTVVIKYFATTTFRDSLEMDDSQELVVAARVTLETALTSLPGSNSSEEVWLDGPYGVVWTDRMPTWLWHHKQMQVYLTTPTGEVLILHLGLDMAWESEYYLLVSIEHTASSHSVLRHLDDRLPDLPVDGPYGTINLTLPGQVERALRACGYEVHFEGPSESHLDRYRLMLASSSLTIEIEYFHDLSSDPVSEGQKSTLRARITLSSPQVQDPPTESNWETRALEWDPWEPTQGWRWNLPKRDIEFTLTTGQKVTLSLGFYLAWIPEYCLAIEVQPTVPSITTNISTWKAVWRRLKLAWSHIRALHAAAQSSLWHRSIKLRETLGALIHFRKGSHRGDYHDSQLPEREKRTPPQGRGVPEGT